MTHRTLVCSILCGVLLQGSATEGEGSSGTVDCPAAVQEVRALADSDRPAEMTVRIVADANVGFFLSAISNEFESRHPDIRIRLQTGHGISPIDGLTAGVSDLAVLPRAAWPMERRPFRQTYGYEATDIVIGRVGFVAQGHPNPPAAYVNSRNPLDGITLDQLGRIFTSGAAAGDISHWRQLGLSGAWAGRRIHAYGRRDDGTELTGLRHEFWQGRPLTLQYEPLQDDEAVIAAVEQDPFGIALLGTADWRSDARGVRMLALAAKDDDAFSDGTYAQVLDDRYPLSPGLHVYFNRQPGSTALDATLHAYLAFMLSERGQRLLKNFSSRDGLVPLTPSEVSRQMARLQAIAPPREQVNSSDWAEYGRPLPAPHRPRPVLDSALKDYVMDPDDTQGGTLSGSVPPILPGLAREWAAGFRKFQPTARIRIDPPFEAPQGSMSRQLSAFLQGKLEFAFLSRIMTRADEATFRRAHGYEPIVIPVSGGSFDHYGFVDTVVVIVNPANPVEALTLQQLDAMFSNTRYRGGAATTRWGDVGLGGVWASRPIHVLGVPTSIAEESARAAFVRERILDFRGRQGAWRDPERSAVPQYRTIEAGVSEDPCAIGFTGLGHVQASLKVLGLGRNGAVVYPTRESVSNWEYPLTRQIYMVLSRPQQSSQATLLGEFVKYILSRDGQQAVLDQGVFLPLREAQAMESLQILRAAHLGRGDSHIAARRSAVE
jgi:phosphate transport system substrate-binding protein